MYNSAKGSGGFPVSHKSLPCTNFTSKIPTGGFPSEPVAANMAAFLRGNIWRFSLVVLLSAGVEIICMQIRIGQLKDSNTALCIISCNKSNTQCRTIETWRFAENMLC